ncbi:MAG: 50S ribosomal protein L4 [Elusimicrobia bacterium]|nr:50S ribosomal protein L4 [Elusimicrobiota bacterium]
MQAQLMNIKGAAVGKVELSDALFGRRPSPEFLHEYVTVYLANQRRGTANTKTRAEVSGSGKKPWKQKHTGRARAGSFRSPLWRHGGVTFGPRAGRARLDFPRAKARLALVHALSAKQAEGALVFVESLGLEEAKTKLMVAMLDSLKCGERKGCTLLVLDAPDAKLARASRNIPNVELALAGDVSAYGVLRARRLVVTKPALEKLQARCASLTETSKRAPSAGGVAKRPAAKGKVN